VAPRQDVEGADERPVFVAPLQPPDQERAADGDPDDHGGPPPGKPDSKRQGDHRDDGDARLDQEDHSVGRDHLTDRGCPLPHDHPHECDPDPCAQVSGDHGVGEEARSAGCVELTRRYSAAGAVQAKAPGDGAQDQRQEVKADESGGLEDRDLREAFGHVVRVESDDDAEREHRRSRDRQIATEARLLDHLIG